MVSKINKFFNKKIRTLIFFVTARCPLRCAHCFYSKELNQKMNELTLKEIEKIADNLPDLETLQISGGEPFLRKDLVELLEIFVKRGVKKIGIPTNGFFTDEAVRQAKRIKKLNIPFSINVSIDGFKETHNKIRGRDCWDKAIKTFKELQKLNIEVNFLVAVSKMNYDEVLDLFKYLESLNPGYINPIIVRAKPDIMLSVEQFIKLRPRLEEISNKYQKGLYKKRQILLYDIYENVLRGKSLPYKCQAGKIIAVLEPDGQVRSCEILRKLGNVRDHDYDMKKILKKDKIPRRCGNCIHPCFIGPSMSYSLKWMLKNILYRSA